MILDRIDHVLKDCVQQLIGDKISLSDERAEDVHHEVLDLAGVLVVDNLEHQAEEPNRDLSAVLKVEDHVEGLDIRKILQQIEVPLECGILWILQARQLLDEEHEDGLDLAWLLIGCLRGKNAEDVGNTASSEQLNIPVVRSKCSMFHQMDMSVEEPASIVDEVFIREVESKWNIFIIAGLLIRLIIIFRISAKVLEKMNYLVRKAS